MSAPTCPENLHVLGYVCRHLANTPPESAAVEWWRDVCESVADAVERDVGPLPPLCQPSPAEWDQALAYLTAMAAAAARASTRVAEA